MFSCCLAAVSWIFSESYCWLRSSISLDSLLARARSTLSGTGPLLAVAADPEAPAVELGSTSPAVAAIVIAVTRRPVVRANRAFRPGLTWRLECLPTGERSTFAAPFQSRLRLEQARANAKR